MDSKQRLFIIQALRKINNFCVRDKRHCNKEIGTHRPVLMYFVRYEPREKSSENWSSGFLTRSDTNRAVQSQKMARGLKFRIYEEEVLYYPCSENKGADQLCGHREADLRLCFRICKRRVFS